MGADRIAVLVRESDEESPSAYTIQARANLALSMAEHRVRDSHFGESDTGEWYEWYLNSLPLLLLAEYAEEVRQELIRPPHYVLTPGGQIRLWHLLDLPTFLDFYAGSWVVRANGY